MLKVDVMTGIGVVLGLVTAGLEMLSDERRSIL